MLMNILYSCNVVLVESILFYLYTFVQKSKKHGPFGRSIYNCTMVSVTMVKKISIKNVDRNVSNAILGESVSN